MTFRKRARLIRARRHLNKGQIAIVAAKAYPETSQGKTSSKSEEVRRRFPVHQGALSRARTIIHYGPELAGAAAVPFFHKPILVDLKGLDSRKSFKFQGYFTCGRGFGTSFPHAWPLDLQYQRSPHFLRIGDFPGWRRDMGKRLARAAGYCPNSILVR
jgi:hypothetical protein